jgi:alkylation response protein AidB-like acyl-CoA dehydrogenase
MDFELDDDQLALRDAAVELLGGFASPAQVRVVVDGGGGLDPKLWAAMVEQGWTGIAVPGALGGLGLGWVEMAVLLEQVGAFRSSNTSWPSRCSCGPGRPSFRPCWAGARWRSSPSAP